MKRINLLMIGLLLFTVQAQAATYYVNPGTDLVQSVVSSAAAGDVVIMRAGVHKITYAIIINNSITLKGEGWTNTVLEKHNGTSSTSTAIRINDSANSCVIRDFELKGRGQGGSGILCYSNYNVFRYLNVHNCGSDQVKSSGILFHESNYNDVQNCYSNYNKKVGFSHFDSRNNYLSNITGDNNELEGLTIDCESHNTHCEYSSFSNNCGRHGLLGGGVGGIGIDNSNGAWLEYSTIHNSKGNHGVTIQNNCGPSDGVRIRYNTISDSDKNGIYINNCSYDRRSTNTGLAGNTFTGTVLNDIEWCEPNNYNRWDEQAGFSQPGEMELTIYPNPASEKLMITGSSLGSGVEIDLFTLSGQKMTLKDPINTNGTYILDVNELERGIYLYKITETQSITSGKIHLQ